MNLGGTIVEVRVEVEILCTWLMSYKGNVIGVLVVSLDWSGESLSGPTAYSDVPMRG